MSAALLPAVTTLLLLVVSCCCSAVPSPVVEVTGGAVQGAREQSARGRDYYAYRAVPYAGSPEADNRFKPPPPLVPWSGVLQCVTPGEYCAQAGRGQLLGEEDCLHLSVYSPQLPENGESPKLPVLVWLPGGAFIVSGAADYDPRLLMDKDLVLVVPQYRLGFFGFIHAFDPAPGNYGMLDQRAALRWVQDNIAKFGGDPSRVTLGGDCAGGASALYHMISPGSHGLFHGVMSMSGTPLDLWAKHPPLRRTMVMVADQLRCPRSALGRMVDCFRAVPTELLLHTMGSLLENWDLLVGNGYMAPAIQGASVKDEAAQFLMEEPLLPFHEGRYSQVPVMLMAARDEGNYILGMTLYEWLKRNSEEGGADVNDTLVRRIIKDLGIPPKEKEEEAMWAQYLPGLRGAPYMDKLDGLAQMLGDALYNTGLLHTARYLNDRAPTYLMRFDFEAGPQHFVFHPDPSQAPPVPPGAGHLDQLNYFLPPSYEPFSSSEQRRVSELTLDIVDNFVNGRPPATDWSQFTDEGLECATISREGQLGQDRFLPPNRVNTSELIFQRHQMTPLYKLGLPPPRAGSKDEL